jgi:hypothetical protein
VLGTGLEHRDIGLLSPRLIRNLLPLLLNFAKRILESPPIVVHTGIESLH